MNPFDESSVAERYEDWYVGPGRRADALEKRLLRKLLLPSAKTILEVGSGEGNRHSVTLDVRDPVPSIRLRQHRRRPVHSDNGIFQIVESAAEVTGIVFAVASEYAAG
jgi:hypothetical protein